MSVRGCFFFFKQKTAYELRISDWSSDVCSSDLAVEVALELLELAAELQGLFLGEALEGPGRFHVGELVHALDPSGDRLERSEERRVGKGCVSTCRSRWSPEH